MERPSTPRIEPSEPEKKQAVVDTVLDDVSSGEMPRIIGFGAVREWLQSAGLDIDSDGFIVDSETGSYVEPYAYSREEFKEIESPVDDPIQEYARPETECEWLIGAKERLHLADLHSVYPFGEDDEPHPVRDNTMNLREMIRETGMTYRTVTEWSDGVDLILESEATPITIRDSRQDLTLNCFDCGYSGHHESWGRDDDCERGTLRCPDCNCLWKNFSIDTCTACQTTHRWEDITPEDDGDGDAAGAMYWEPSCPECGADASYLHSESRYRDFETSTTAGELWSGDKEQSAEWVEEAKAFDYQ